MGGLTRKVRRILRHLSWVRTQGLGRLIEEDELNPVVSLKLAGRRWVWRRLHSVPEGTAMPVFVLGVQRSGTNMVIRGFRSSPEFEVFNESDSRAFIDFRLRPIEAVRTLVLRSGHRWVLLKPLCDSHRAVELLEELSTPTPPRALWVHRRVDSRVRSALAKFGDANLKALERIAAGKGDGLWQAGGLSPENLALVRSFNYSTLGPASAAALFWYLRNSLFFQLGLDRRTDVMAVSYDRLVRNPGEVMRQVCEFLGCAWNPRYGAHIEARDPALPAPLDIDPRIRACCEELQARFASLPPPESGAATAPSARESGGPQTPAGSR